MEEYISREEHEEFRRRIEDDRERTNTRLKILEGNMQQLSNLTASVRELALNVGHLAEQQGEMVSRVDALEKEPAKNWSALKTSIIGALAAAFGSGLVAAIANFIQ